MKNVSVVTMKLIKKNDLNKRYRLGTVSGEQDDQSKRHCDNIASGE